MMTKFTNADVVVVALIGERGRELGNFVSEILNDESRKRTVTVLAVPADKSPLLRIKGAERATSIAEYFRSKGKNVLLIMDSLYKNCSCEKRSWFSIGRNNQHQRATPFSNFYDSKSD